MNKKSKSLIVGEVYRIPNSNLKDSCEKYNQILSSLSNSDAIIGTDQNINFLNMDNLHASSLFTTYLSHSMIPTITKATRITHSTATLIDNIIVKYNPRMQILSRILISDISDHLPVLCCFGVPTKLERSNKPQEYKCIPISKVGVDAINNALCTINWDYLQEMHVDDATRTFTSRLTELIDIYLPVRTVQVSSRHIKRDPWITRGLVVSSNKCIKLYRKCCRLTRDDIRYIDYILYKNLFNKLKRLAKEKYYNDLFNVYSRDIRKTWQTLKLMIGKQNDKSSISKMFTINNTQVTDPKIIADKFCDFFSGVGRKYADKIPNSRKSPMSYLAANSRSNAQSLFMGPTDINEISVLLNRMKPKKSAGNDDLNACILKKVSVNILEPITAIINKSLESGLVPDCFKIAKVIPIHKGKAKDDFSNYRPISLLPVMSKLLERVVHKRLYHFMELSNVFSPVQFGFRPRHSTTHAVTRLVTDIINAKDNKETTLSTFLDLSKAFDTIDHRLLILKLQHYGVRGNALDWFRSYLSNRTQYVRYLGIDSECLDLTCGVPQGSVLGPLLFILYTNDLPGCIRHSKSILFADDTTIYVSSADVNTLYTMMNDDLRTVSDWFHANKLSLNVSKTNYILFSKLQDICRNRSVSLCGGDIKKVTSTKFLGMTIDCMLKWDKHIEFISKKISSSLFIMNKIKHNVSSKLLKTLYYSMVYPYLTYGIPLWGNTFRTITNRLNILNKKALRVITKSNYCAHTEPLFKSMNILNFEDLHTYCTNQFSFNYIRQELPLALMNMYSYVGRREAYPQTRSRTSKYTLQTRMGKSECSSRSIVCFGPKLWNSVSQLLYLNNAGVLVSSGCFKLRLKRQLMKKYNI